MKTPLENSVKVAEHIITHNGKEVFKGTQNQCYIVLQRSQSQSAQHAIRYEGWKVAATGEEMSDSVLEVTIKKVEMSTITFDHNGVEYYITKDAVYASRGDLKAGAVVKVDTYHAY